jgi:D-sedoheptulose 7-phosphate isomerase
MTAISSAEQAKSVVKNYFESVSSLMSRIDSSAVGRVFEVLREARNRRATIFVAGNGGSAATATHWTTDMGKATKGSGQAPFRIMCLSDNVSWLTALGNDEGYERVFAGQLENFSQEGDVLVVISASGNSPNLICAVELAKQRGSKTIGFLGFDGGKLKGMVDNVVWVQTELGAYEQVEDCHMALCHVLTKCLSQDTNYASHSD